MVTILLVIIYLAFISLGLPDSLLGAAWPAVRLEFGMALDAAGILSIVSIGFTILSSLANGFIIRRIGAGKLTLISCVLTGSALMGFSVAPSFIWLVILAIPLGFGGGSVDASLNNYVAAHFKSHHMNWLHSFWGLGATVGPIIMGYYIESGTWRDGYRTISTIQLSLSFILLLSLPLWKMHEKEKEKTDGVSLIHLLPDERLLKKKGVKLAMATFLLYVAVEMSVGLWGSSYLVQVKNLEIETAARWVAFYFGGIMVGRFMSGFMSFRFNNTQMIRIGIGLALLGALILLLPTDGSFVLVGLVLIGIGFAPIFPSMIHETPKRFGRNNAGTIIGYQMASSYLGGATVPALLGVAGKNISMNIFPPFVCFMILSLLIVTEVLSVKTKNETT